MSSQTHTITLTAKDGTKQTFDAIKRGAEQDTRALQEMGRQGSAGLKQVDDAAKKTAKSTDDLNKRMAAFGAVVTGGAALLGAWSRSSQEADAIQRQLEASIAATGESYDVYADRIEAAGEAAVQLGQDDEAAMQAISALTQITGSANVALENMGLVMDLAAAKSMSLESAAELVGKVHEGNTGILQRYGIVVAENATAEEALAQIQQQVAGQAEAHATTYARLREELSNLTDAIGGAVGEFAPMLALLPGISSGLTLAGSAAGALAPNLTKAGAATAALNLAMGPAGLVAVAGLAATAGYLLSEQWGSQYVDAVMAARDASEDLIDTINRLLSAGDENALLGQEWRAGVVGTAAILQDLGSEIERTKTHLAELREEQKQAGVDNSEQIAIFEDQLRSLQGLEAMYGDSATAAREYGETLDAITAIIAHTGPGQDAILQKAQALHDEFSQRGISGFKDYADGMQELAGSMAKYDEEALKATKATADATAGFKPLGDAIKAVTNQLRAPILDPSAEGSMGELARNLDAIGDAAGRAGDIARARAVTLGDQLEAETIGIEQYTEAIAGIAEPFRELADAQAEVGAALSASGDLFGKTASTIEAFSQAAEEAAAHRETIVSIGGALTEAAGLFGEAADAVDAYSETLRENETAAERMARGSTSAAVALRAFKDIQDGILSDQGQFTHQLSEYGQQLNYLQDAEDLLNQRREEGIALTAEQEDFLNRVNAAQERLTGGQEDATLALGEQALVYAENMKLGDQLNDSLGGVTGAVGGLTSAVETLTALLVELNGTDAEPSVAIAGIHDEIANTATLAGNLDIVDSKDVSASVAVTGVGQAISETSTLIGNLFTLDNINATSSVTNTTTNVTNTINREVHEVIGTMARGGLVGAAQGRMVRVNEGGREMATLPTGDDVWLPNGTMVWPHAASTMGNRGKGAIPFTNYGSITIVANNPVEFGAHLRDYGLAGR